MDQSILINTQLPIGILPPLEQYIVTPQLEDDSGTIGCLDLAEKELIED
ncbi:hypothetical protein [Enterococcus rotai]